MNHKGGREPRLLTGSGSLGPSSARRPSHAKAVSFHLLEWLLICPNLYGLFLNHLKNFKRSTCDCFQKYWQNLEKHFQYIILLIVSNETTFKFLLLFSFK